MFMHDWMHCCLSSGTLTVTCWLLLLALEASGVKIWEALEAYVALWTLPKAVANIKLEQLFGAKRITSCKKADAFKTSASELLTLHAILAYYVRSCILKNTDSMQYECEAFLTMSLLVDMLQTCSQGHRIVTPAQLRNTANLVIQLMFKANWSSYLIKKFHWQLHFGDHWARHSKLPGTFTMERKHKQITRYAANLKNTKTYEKSLYEEVVSHELYNLQSWQFWQSGCGLINPHAATKKLLGLVKQVFDMESLEAQSCLTALTARLEHGGQAGKGDVCLLRPAAANDPWDCCEIWCHISLNNDMWTIGSVWQLVSLEKPTNSALWKSNDKAILISTKDILAAVPYSKAGEQVRTLTPYHLRI